MLSYRIVDAPQPPHQHANKRLSPPHDPPGVCVIAWTIARNSDCPLLPESPTHSTYGNDDPYPREAYSPEELQRLYPKGLKLQLVQVVSWAIYNPVRGPELG